MVDLLWANTYAKRLIGLGAVALFPLYDQSGSAAFNPLGADGVATGVTWGAPGIGDGRSGASFDGVNDYVTVLPGVGAFDGGEGTVLCWGRVSGAGVWGDATFRRMVEVNVNVNNRVFIGKTNVTNEVHGKYVAGGTDKEITTTVLAGSVLMFSLIASWSVAADEFIVAVNGVQIGAALTGLGTWVGTPGAAYVGASGAGAAVFDGALAYGALWDRALSVGEMAYVGVL